MGQLNSGSMVLFVVLQQGIQLDEDLLQKIRRSVRENCSPRHVPAKQRDISVSEFFAKNRHLLGFDNPRKSLLTTVKEAVDNSLDACEEAGILYLHENCMNYGGLSHEHTLRLLHPPGHDYYEVLRKKLRWSEHPS